MKAYVKRQFEDPIDGPYPTRKSKWMGSKRRRALKRKMRGMKKTARRCSFCLTIRVD